MKGDISINCKGLTRSLLYVALTRAYTRQQIKLLNLDKKILLEKGPVKPLLQLNTIHTKQEKKDLVSPKDTSPKCVFYCDLHPLKIQIIQWIQMRLLQPEAMLVYSPSIQTKAFLQQLSINFQIIKCQDHEFLLFSESMVSTHQAKGIYYFQDKRLLYKYRSTKYKDSKKS